MSTFFNLWFTFHGRVNRGKYWLVAVINISVVIIFLAIAFILFGGSLLTLPEDASASVIAGLVSKGIGFVLLAGVLYILMMVSGVLVGIKRLHDRNKSGWWLILFYGLPTLLFWVGSDEMELVIFLINVAIWIWALVELGCLRGTIGPNRYGPDPLPAAA